MTDIDELLRDKLREGELITAIETVNKVIEQEVTKVIKEDKVFSPDVGAKFEQCIEEVKSKLTEDSLDMSEDTRIISKDEPEEYFDTQNPPRGHRRPRRENQKHQIAEPKAVDSTADTTVPTDTSVEVKTNSTNEIVTVSVSPATLSQIAQHKNASLFATAVSDADAPEYRYLYKTGYILLC